MTQEKRVTYNTARLYIEEGQYTKQQIEEFLLLFTRWDKALTKSMETLNNDLSKRNHRR